MMEAASLWLPWLHGVPLGMSGINSNCLDPDSSNHPMAAGVLAREEPDEEEDEDETEDEGDGDEDDGDEGYSE